jgi:DNA-directed RNA polymerase sigma subunit (sigma70/sigma32)
MQVKAVDEMATVIASCLEELDEIERAFIRQYFLNDQKTTLPQFARRWGLSAKKLTELRSRVAVRLREVLAERTIYSIGDIL